MLTWNALTRHAPTEGPTTEQEIATMQQRREALQIRPLLEYPALREVMGLDGPAAVAVESTGRVVKHRSGGRRTPKDAAAPRSIWATTNRGGRSKPHPRFDRRALLESDNAS